MDAEAENIYTVLLSLPEYGLVAAYVGLEGLLGVPDPFDGLDETQQAEALEAASRALQERGLLAIDEAGQSVELDVVTAALVKATGLAERVVALSLKTEADYAQRLVFVGPELIVEQQEADEQVTLTAVRDGEVLTRRAAEFLACDYPGGLVGEGFHLGLDTLADAQQMVSEPDACREALTAGGVPQEVTELLGDALCGPHHLGTLSVFAAAQEGEAQDSLAFLVAPMASWILRHGPSDQNGVTAQPATGQEIEARVREVLVELLRETSA